MFGLGMGELILILIAALLFLGPQKLPEAAKAIGKGIRSLRRHTMDLKDTLEQDETIGPSMRELRSALQDDPRWDRNRTLEAIPREPQNTIAAGDGEKSPAAAELPGEGGVSDPRSTGTGNG